MKILLSSDSKKIKCRIENIKSLLILAILSSEKIKFGKVIISDKTVDQYESNLMRRICGLIYFPDKECAEIKLKLMNSK